VLGLLGPQRLGEAARALAFPSLRSVMSSMASRIIADRCASDERAESDIVLLPTLGTRPRGQDPGGAFLGEHLPEGASQLLDVPCAALQLEEALPLGFRRRDAEIQVEGLVRRDGAQLIVEDDERTGTASTIPAA